MRTETSPSPVESETGHGIDHAFCSRCYKNGLRQGLCGTPMPDDPLIVRPGAPLDEPCVVCFAETITCNNCGDQF